MTKDCIFCKIATGEISVKTIYEDEYIVAFPDIKPAAPVHVLVIPRKHIDSLATAGQEVSQLLAHLMLTLPKIAEKIGIADTGFRIVANTGQEGGQTVMHLHWHLMGGRFMTWPPG